MNEAITILFFALIMVLIELKNVSKIQIKARTNYVRRIMTIIISVAIIVLFWSKPLSFKVETIALIILLLFCAIMPEGLGQEQVIKVGNLNSNLKTFQKIELEPEDTANRFTRVRFFTHKNNYSYLVVKGNVDLIKNFLQKQMAYSGNLVIKR